MTKQIKKLKKTNNNPPTPINTQRDIQAHIHTHTRTHTRTHKHTSSYPLYLLDRDMARHRDLRQGKSHPWGPTTLRGLPAHDYKERRQRDIRDHRDSPDPGQSSPQNSTPVSGPKAAPSVVGPHEETLELKTEN